MSSISIIGSGNMASGIGAMAVKGGNTVEVIRRDPAKAAAPGLLVMGLARNGLGDFDSSLGVRLS